MRMPYIVGQTAFLWWQILKLPVGRDGVLEGLRLIAKRVSLRSSLSSSWWRIDQQLDEGQILSKTLMPIKLSQGYHTRRIVYEGDRVLRTDRLV
jgi:hypothetical protein